MVAERVLIMPQRFAANNLPRMGSTRGNNNADAKRTEAYSRQSDTLPSEGQMPTIGFSAVSNTQEEFRAQIRQVIADNAWIMDELAKL